MSLTIQAFIYLFLLEKVLNYLVKRKAHYYCTFSNNNKDM